MIVGETQHFRKFPHDTALDFLDGWLGFMWDVFFFFGGVLGGGFWL